MIPGKADEDGHAIESAIDETLRVVNRIDPHTQLLHRHTLILLNLLRVVVESDGVGVQVDGALVLGGLLPHYCEFGEEEADGANEHGLYFEVSLGGGRGTYVTGSLMPFSYFLRFGFYAHCLATRQAWKASWVTTLM